MNYEVLHYLTASGRNVFKEWLESLKDDQAATRVVSRIDRLESGNFGDCKPLQGGVWELRIDCGPGYRVYYSILDRVCVLLLCGGDKRKQGADIHRAVEFLKDYKQRTILEGL